MEQVKAKIRDVPDFPKPGITFKDITPVLQDARCFRRVIDCLAEAFTPQQVRVTANPPGFVPGPDRSGVTASREVSSFGCDNTGTVTLTIRVPDGPANVELEELLPDGLKGSNPSAGTFDAAGSVLAFSGRAPDGMVITYDVSDVTRGNFGCSSRGIHFLSHIPIWINCQFPNSLNQSWNFAITPTYTKKERISTISSSLDLRLLLQTLPKAL